MTPLKAFKSFDIDTATISLWLFKTTPQSGQAPKYRGRWVDTHDMLDKRLKEAVTSERHRITELQDYSLTAQNNEGSALSIEALVTNAGFVISEATSELPERRVKTMKEIQNTSFYAIKFVHAGKILLAVRKAEGSWQTKKMKDVIYAFFTGTRLALDDKPSFRISPFIDFFIFDGQVLIANKGNFESILAYKQAHIEDFQKLQKDPEFQALFTTLGPLVSFVGSNKMHLRRACAIHEKKHYKDKNFMGRLVQDYAKYQLDLKFDSQGRIVPTDKTCADIIRALLDHRLLSPFSEQLYNVEDAAIVP